MMTIRRYSQHWCGQLSRLSLGAAALILTALPIAPEAVAQEGGLVLEEIVVTAQKREQGLQDVPISMFALGSEEIERANAQSVKDLVTKMSGVLIQDHYGTNTFYVIRGIGLNDFRSNSSPSAAVYVDEVYQGNMLSGSPPTYDVERVEVLKGPQGTLYGRNASSGAVNVITRKPTEEFGGYAKAGVGRFGHTTAEGAFGGAISENVMFRLAAQYSDYQDTVFENVSPASPPPAGASTRAVPDADIFAPESLSIRGQLRWQPSDVTDVLLQTTFTSKSGSSSNSLAIQRAQNSDPGAATCPGSNASSDLSIRQGCVAGTSADIFVVPPTGDRVLSHNFASDNEADFWDLSLHIDHNFSWSTLTSITAVTSFDTDQRFDFDATAAEALNVRQEAEDVAYSQEVRLSNVADNGVRWMFGVNGGYEKYEEPNRTFYAGTLDTSQGFPLGSINYSGAPGRVDANSPHFATRTTDANSLFQDITQRTKNFALFTDNEIPLSDTWSIFAGYRFTYEKREFVGAGFVGFNDGTFELTNRDNLGPAQGNGELTTKRSSGRFGVNWRANDNLLVYGSFSESFKSGGFDAGFLNNITFITNPYDPEIVRSVEIGLKADPRDNLRINAAIYYTDFDSPQVRISDIVTLPNGDTIPQSILSNLDEARVFGLDAELVWRATDNFTFSATASLLDTQISQPGNATFDDKPLSHAPEQTITADGTYAFSLGNNYTARLQANVKYLSDHTVRLGSRPIDEQEAYSVVDASVSFAPNEGDWEIAIFGRNLADEVYFVDGQGGFGANRFNLGMPQTYGISARVNF